MDPCEKSNHLSIFWLTESVYVERNLTFSVHSTSKALKTCRLQYRRSAISNLQKAYRHQISQNKFIQTCWQRKWKPTNLKMPGTITCQMYETSVLGMYICAFRAFLKHSSSIHGYPLWVDKRVPDISEGQPNLVEINFSLTRRWSE